ncbi:MAG: hypothetical protein Q7T57_01530, partial [Dehalococcoidales bacterium]|nr:hypothetical protein [Dehalococcoidales bacterium]
MSTDPAVPIAKGYYAEAAIMGVTCAILWGFMITQMLVYRFTPRRRWVGTKTNMLVCGFVA